MGKRATEYTNFEEDLLENLEDDAFMTAFLNDAASDDDPDEFLRALRWVVLARGGFEQFAKSTELGQSSLYRMLDTDGNPRLSSIRAVLDSLGLKIRVDAV